jgi:hypothetical protein
MLQTAVHEIETAAELEKIINSTLTDSFKNENENVMVCAGRMGLCVSLFTMPWKNWKKNTQILL